MASRRCGQGSFLPAWNLTLRAISYWAGPQLDHRSEVTKEDLIKLVVVYDTDPSLGSSQSGTGLWFPGLPQDLQPRSSHSKVLRPRQALVLGRRQTKQRGYPPGSQVD